jgi:hypothetical protein
MAEVKTGLVIPNPGQPAAPREMSVPEKVSVTELAARAQAMAPRGGAPLGKDAKK